MNRDVRWVDGAGKPDPYLMDEYAAMAAADGIPYYVISVNGQWVCYEYLDDGRETPSYYYVHPSGYVGYGVHAELDAMEKGIGAAPRRTMPSQIRRGKYGRMKHR